MAIVIGIRELRQHASRYLRRVRAGETITLTDRGEPFAEIRPVKHDEGAAARLIRSGRATPPERDLNEFLDRYPPPRVSAEGPSLSEIIIKAREDERP